MTNYNGLIRHNLIFILKKIIIQQILQFNQMKFKHTIESPCQLSVLIKQFSHESIQFFQNSFQCELGRDMLCQ